MTADSTTPPANRYRIVIALDGSEYSGIVLEHAFDQAARHRAPDLHVLTVVESRRADLPSIKSWLAKCVVESLEATGRSDWRTRLHVRAGGAEDEIIKLAAEVGADLIVIGRHGIHHPRPSVADSVVAMATCPTLVVALAGREHEAEPRCLACARARAESDGERWFCVDHTETHEVRLSTLVPPSFSLAQGPLW